MGGLGSLDEFGMKLGWLEVKSDEVMVKLGEL